MIKKISIKDLVLTGVFAVIYMILMTVSSMIGIVPILYLGFPFLFGIIGGIITFLFMAKVQKPILCVILGLIPALFIQLSGYPIIGFIFSIVFLILSEIIRYIGKYKSKKMNMIANGIFNMSNCSSLMMMVFCREKIRPLVELEMGENYTNKIFSILTNNTLILIYISAFIGGMIGAILAKKLLRKHFEKAGII